jgi:hypothetical protein
MGYSYGLWSRRTSAARERPERRGVLDYTDDRTNGPGNRLTRRGFLKAAGAGAAWITLTGTLGCEPTKRASEKTPGKDASAASAAQPTYARTFRSRPELSPPGVGVTTPAHDTAPGYVFLAPKKGLRAG